MGKEDRNILCDTQTIHFRATFHNCISRSRPLISDIARQQGAYRFIYKIIQHVLYVHEPGLKMDPRSPINICWQRMTRLVCRCTLSVHSDLATKVHAHIISTENPSMNYRSDTVIIMMTNACSSFANIQYIYIDRYIYIYIYIDIWYMI